MQYVLGNMLNGGGINPDGLSLDLQFAADKTLTARRGPTPAFSRASGATQVGATGLIEYAPENLMLNSGNVSLMSRLNVPVATSQTGGPLGSYYTLGVDAVNDFHIYRNSGVTPAASASSMMWVLAKRGTARYLRIGGGAASTFDWDTLTFSSISTVHSAGDAVAVGDGWYWLPILRGQTSFIDLAPSSSSGVTFIYNETANITVEVAAIQVSRSILLQNTAPDYIPTTTAAVYGPRFDHDPVTLACKGLLIEEGRTNLLTWSEEFNNTSGWSQALGFATANQTTSPSGNNDADLLSARNILYGGILRRNVAPAYAANTTYTMSVYAKAGTHQFIGLRLSGPSAGSVGNAYSVFTLSGSGSAIATTPVSGTINSVSCVSAGGGWYRCTLVYTTGSTVSGSDTDIAICQSNGNVAFTPAGTETVYLWGAQLEAGSFPTSYIPTTTGTLARSADVCSITGDNFSGFWNQSEGSLFANSAHIASPFPTTVMANSGANSNQISIFRTTPSVCRFGVASGGSYSVVEDFSITSNQSVKMIGAYSSANSRAALNGNLSGLDTSVVVPTNLTRLNIGSAGLASLDFANGHIAAIRYFRKRLPDAKLQALTV